MICQSCGTDTSVDHGRTLIENAQLRRQILRLHRDMQELRANNMLTTVRLQTDSEWIKKKVSKQRDVINRLEIKLRELKAQPYS